MLHYFIVLNKLISDQKHKKKKITNLPVILAISMMYIHRIVLWKSILIECSISFLLFFKLKFVFLVHTQDKYIVFPTKVYLYFFCDLFHTLTSFWITNQNIFYKWNSGVKKTCLNEFTIHMNIYICSVAILSIFVIKRHERYFVQNKMIKSNKTETGYSTL